MTKREIMVKAHQMAKKMVGDYSARLALALRTLWANIKKGVNNIVKAIENLAGTGSEKQIAWATDIINTTRKKLQNELTYFAGREKRENYSYAEIKGKIERGIADLENSSYSAKWWIEHQGVAESFLQRIKRH